MLIIRAGEIAGWQTPAPHERTLKVLLSPSLQPVAAGLSMGMVILPPGQTSSLHNREAEQEVWYVVSGTAKVRVGNEVGQPEPDTLAVVPAGMAHQLTSDGTSDS